MIRVPKNEKNCLNKEALVLENSFKQNIKVLCQYTRWTYSKQRLYTPYLPLFVFPFSFKAIYAEYDEETEEETFFPNEGESLLQTAVQFAESKDVGLEIIKLIAEKAYEKDPYVANYQNGEKETCLHYVADSSKEFSEYIIAFLMKEPYNAKVDIKDGEGRNASARALMHVDNHHVFASWFME